jgi:hypothetical protein
MGQCGMPRREGGAGGKPNRFGWTARAACGTRAFDRRCHPFPRTLVAIMHLYIRHLFAIMVVAVVIVQPMHADDDDIVDEDGVETVADNASVSDAGLHRDWFLPDGTCNKSLCAKLDWFFSPVGEVRAAPTSTTRPTLIEQAETLLDTPRPSQIAVYSLDDSLNPESPVNLVAAKNKFSHTWSDGAPLLLFDWSGRSVGPAGPQGLKLDGVKRVADASTATEWADLSSKVKLRERDIQLDPTVRSAWETDETVKLPVAGSLFVFGQMGASTPAVEQGQYKWLGKTGVGLKVKPWLMQEVQIRCGPAVRYDDTEKLSPGQSPERSELFLEAATKVPVPVIGALNVEYTGNTVPPATPTDRNAVNQDLKLALPINGSGQFHVGATYKWETASATPWMDRMQVYMGFQNKW